MHGNEVQPYREVYRMTLVWDPKPMIMVETYFFQMNHSLNTYSFKVIYMQL